MSSDSNHGSTTTNDEEKPPPHMRLFEFNEDEIQELNHYQILGLEEPVRATPYAIKQAWRKASIRYHPDKTGRDEGDYVFIALRTAWNTLSDVSLKKAYDSTEMPFDDSIPPDVSTASGGDALLYSDEDFYDTFGPVFERNLRFDNRLQQQKKGKVEIPSLGDSDTPIEQVQAFYDYWTQFTSWRDFSQKASEELFENNNPLEDAESRYEKRFYQKEIDKRAKALKKLEMQRIQTLVTRAMAADPRLKQYREQQKAAKEQAAQERKLKQEQEAQRQKEEQERKAKEEQERLALEKERKAQEKLEREREKKQLRKAKQQLRKITIAAYTEDSAHNSDSHHSVYSSLETMSDELEFLCQELTLVQIQDLTDQFTANASFALLHTRAQEQRTIQQQEQQAKDQEVAALQQKEEQEQERLKALAKKEAQEKWTQAELTALGKAVKKFPGGGANRWEQIASYINSSCRPEDPKTKEDCIEKYNQAAKGPAAGGAGATAAAVGTSNNSKENASAANPLTNGYIKKNSTNSTSNGNSNGNNGEATTTTSNGNTPTTPSVNPKTVVAKSESTLTDVSSATDNNNNNTMTNTTTGENAAAAWTEEQDKLLQDALAKYPASMDKNERWASIAKMVTGKTKKQCVQRFKVIRDAIKNKK